MYYGIFVPVRNITWLKGTKEFLGTENEKNSINFYIQEQQLAIIYS